MGAVEDISPDRSSLRLLSEFEAFTALELFDHFVRPELLVKWWPEEATIDPRLGGSYDLRWPSRNWVLSGQYTAFEPGKRLGFTWSWNFDSVKQPLQVDITFEDAEPCTKMTVSHGPFDESEPAQIERNEIREGWIHFSMRLAGLRKGEAT